MQVIKDFRLENVPQHKIAFAATSEPDYSMDRVIVAEDWPDYGDVTIINGSHCSCYGFDETSWDATIYTEQEAKAVIDGWLKSGYGSERLITTAWKMSGR
jgi:hypothetical protein